MIYDAIGNIGRYRDAIPRFEAVAKFLESDFASLPDGRVEIDGDHVFATISTYGAKRREAAVFEAHRRYCDIQIVIDGEEFCGVVPASGWLKETVPYDEEKDIGFFANPTTYSDILLEKGLFAFFAPDDAHMPGVAIGALGNVRKCVIKIEL